MSVLDRLSETEKLRSTNGIISAKDILLEASSLSDLTYLKNYIMKKVLISEKNGRAFLIIDDLEVVAGNSTEVSSLDNEKRISLHSIVAVMDDLNSRGKMESHVEVRSPPFILGICCNDMPSSQSDLVRVGRFEKVISMPPPSEYQRREILNEMFKHLPICAVGNRKKEEVCDIWSVGVAPHTAGCIAVDLKRICTDALTRSKSRAERKISSNCMDHDVSISWSDIREATRLCIPSQLSQLDVTISANFDESTEKTLKILTPRESFFSIWNERFIGYDDTKKKIFRTIVWPWKRHRINSTSQSLTSSLERDVPPPSGVLFHGQSGTGKTFAAKCLARCLNLNIVRVSLRFEEII